MCERHGGSETQATNGDRHISSSSRAAGSVESADMSGRIERWEGSAGRLELGVTAEAIGVEEVAVTAVMG